MFSVWNFWFLPLFLHSLRRGALAYSIMVVRQILVLFVEVRILVGQQRAKLPFRSFYFGIVEFRNFEIRG